MTKQEQFLYIVQTTILANGINLTASGDETAKKYRHEYSATGVLILMDEAVRASGLIPDSLSAYEAANEFCGFMLSNLKEIEEEASGKKMTVPHWFARH